jgi:hypothetical protein
MTRNADQDHGRGAHIDLLHVKVGAEASLYGATRLTLERSGHFVLEHEGGRKGRARIVGDARELLDESIDEVFHRAEVIAWRSPSPTRPGVPDEAAIEWRLRTPDGEVTAEMWLRDAEEEAAIAALLAPLRTLVKAASGGTLIL